MKYAGTLAFSPSGTLFVGDNITGSIFAYETGAGTPASIDIRGLAEHFVATFEGALILAKAQNDVAPSARSLQHYKRYLRTIFSNRTASKETSR